jgi:hypothetical protein
MSERVLIGPDARIYYNAGTYGSPTWTEIDTVKDVSRTSEWERSDVTCRKHRRKRAYVKTIQEQSFEFELTAFVTDAAYLALEAAFDGSDSMEFLVLNQAITVNGARGIRGSFHVTKLDESQPLNGHITCPIQLSPADSANAQARVTVTSGTLGPVT